jgi:lysylphosphatidylglycerol synthetase-like protein (DUF2156 family)
MSSGPGTRRTRPLGIAVIAVFLVVDAGLMLLQLGVDSTMSTRTATLLRISDLAPAGFVILSLLRLVAAVGLWRGSRRAWVLAMLLIGVGLITSLYLYALEDPPYSRMAIDVVIAFYLNQGAVRDYFEGRPAGRGLVTVVSGSTRSVPSDGDADDADGGASS